MRIRVIDAFTDQPFTGNPAAVCLLDEPDWPASSDWPDAQWMQQVAMEMNHAETAFALPRGDAWKLRWFTPSVEVDLCGHATLATVHALRTDGRLKGKAHFTTRSGVLTAETHDDDTITLDFPAASITPVAIPPGVTQAIGAPIIAAHTTGTLGDLIVELDDETTVRTLAPDLTRLSQLPYRGVVTTAAADEPHGSYAFISRFFAPRLGVDEDPATGSTHTALGPLWSARLDRTELTGLQASARGGLIRTRVTGNRVHLTGHAVTTLDAVLQIQPSRQ